MAAAFMRFGGVAKALVDLAAAWLSGLPGSLGLVTVVACTLFAAVCGSSVATALAMGTILIPAMLERGYPRSFALGVVGASGTIGIVIPPSLPLILYGIVAEQSAAPVPRRHRPGCAPGRRLLLLGPVRSPPPQISDRAAITVARANTRDVICSSRAARALGRHGRHLWWLRHRDRSRGTIRRRGARRFADFLSRIPLVPDTLGYRDGITKRGEHHADHCDGARGRPLAYGIGRSCPPPRIPARPSPGDVAVPTGDQRLAPRSWLFS